jgi:hypothetical protein
MSRRALTISEFAVYAREQIRVLDALLGSHDSVSLVTCRCGRPLLCPQAESLHSRRNHYVGRLAVGQQTQPLPVMSVDTAPPQSLAVHPRSLFYRLVGRLRRGTV